MFKYNQFPILRLQAYNNEGLLHRKTLCQKSSTPYHQTSTYSLSQIIDIETTEHLTLKKIKKSKNLCKESTLSEISNQSRFKNNQNFIQIQQVYEDHEHIYILMEDNGVSLQEYLDIRGCLFEREVQYIFCQLVSILEVLRMNNVFHGSISLRTLFIQGKDMKVKLSGFNHSINMQKVKIQPHANLYSETELSPYTAPQLLDNTIESPYTYYAGDVWAIGVVLYTLLVGEQPFTNHDEQKELTTASIMKLKNFMFEFPSPEWFLQKNSNKKESGNRHSKKGSLSPQWKQLLKKIFLPRQYRITLQQLIKHPFNNITQSKFTQLNCKQAPRISNHFLSSQDETVEMIRFSAQTQKSLSSTKPKLPKNLILSNGQLNNQQLIPIPSCVIKQISDKPLLCLGEVTTNILSIILSQEKQPPILPFISQHPTYIEQYCYIKKNNCVGYIFDNNIGVVFQDGSCALGKNKSDFKYYTNQGLTMEDVLGLYVGLYDRFYRSSSLNNESSESDQINESSSNNINIQNGYTSLNSNQNSSSGSKISTKQLLTGKNSHKVSEASQSSQKSLHTFGKSKRQKMMQASSINTNKSELNGQASIHKGVSPGLLSNQYSFIKFGESFISNSINPLRQLFNGNKERARINDFQQYPIPSHKYDIFQYYVDFFGDRVIDSTKKVSVLGFWTLNCGIVFLFSNGVWQVNLNQGIYKNSSNDSMTTLLTYPCKKKNRQKKKQNECAVIIDQYGLAWWLKQNKGRGYDKSGESRNAMDGFFGGVNVGSRVGNCRVQKLGTEKSVNDGYNRVGIKIARKAIGCIKGSYLRQFEDIMEPYKYAYP